jgi:hypothetical protein
MALGADQRHAGVHFLKSPVILYIAPTPRKEAAAILQQGGVAQGASMSSESNTHRRRPASNMSAYARRHANICSRIVLLFARYYSMTHQLYRRILLPDLCGQLFSNEPLYTCVVGNSVLHIAHGRWTS